MRRQFLGLVGTGAAAFVLSGCKRSESGGESGSSEAGASSSGAAAQIRLGYFGNLTHAQAVLGVASGEFAGAIAPSALNTKVFNAGPSLIEALMAGEIDVGYVGPGPALNAHVKTKGTGIRVLGGACANGVLIVARKDSGINSLAELKNKRIATPQHGNTQDIAARYYVTHTLHQADANNIIPIANAEQTGLMQRGTIDAAWAPEPWGSRLVVEADAKVIGQESDLWPDHKFVLTLVVTTPEFLAAHPDVVKKLLAVHHNWTTRLQNLPQKFIPQLEDALFAVNGKRLPKGVLAAALKNVQFTDDPMPETIGTMANWAYELQFSPRPANLTGFIDTSILDSVKSGH